LYGYVTVDVFTPVRFGGNPLAVITDARGLSDGDMARIAREFNYSVTTYVLPPADPTNTERVRIVTPTGEIPFAGHPNVGTGYVLGQIGTAFDRRIGNDLRFEEVTGLVNVELVRDAIEVTGARITAPEPVSIGKSIDPPLAAACVELVESDLRTENHLPRLCRSASRWASPS
jgi:trans-2,3-dihydro-3-hydroxyanthranilate isomerase